MFAKFGWILIVCMVVHALTADGQPNEGPAGDLKKKEKPAGPITLKSGRVWYPVYEKLSTIDVRKDVAKLGDEAKKQLREKQRELAEKERKEREEAKANFVGGKEIARPQWCAVFYREGSFDYYWVEITKDTKMIFQPSSALPQRIGAGLPAGKSGEPGFSKGFDIAKMGNGTWKGILETFHLIEMKVVPTTSKPEFKGKEDFERGMIRNYQTKINNAVIVRAVEIRIVGYKAIPGPGVKFLPGNLR